MRGGDSGGRYDRDGFTPLLTIAAATADLSSKWAFAPGLALLVPCGLNVMQIPPSCPPPKPMIGHV